MRCAFLTIALFALSAAPAAADVRLIDPATGASTTLVKGDKTRLVAGVEGGLLIERANTRSILGVDGSRTAAPQFDDADSVGPTGRTIRMQPRGFELRASDGQIVGSYPADLFVWFIPRIGWSADGSRVAVLVGRQLRVLDTATGAVLVQRASEGDLGEQAFSPDASALVFIDDDRAYRLDIATGQTADLGREATDAAWSTTGRIALSSEDGIVVPGEAGVRAANGGFNALWSPDGKTLAFSTFVTHDACTEPDDAIAVASPGAAPTLLVGPSAGTPYGRAWAPDGRLAVDVVQQRAVSEKRGKRHPWPKRVAGDYEMFTRGGNAAIRRVVVRFASALKRGASRETALSRLRLGMAKVQKHFDETDDTAVRDAIAVEIDRWLYAAGFRGVESSDEFTC
ncbi:hypothetical protein OM076_27405 [Solirubrobacter ginsenosidimutans]|uniref:WD40 repeat domain-containing protein n=1 Tax=Solirubrobacter ginsenosidimutans TaxID=490573 RepID=A0A9X3MZA8_9ACTN|nr:hypothetical protein [Solirubrobacter ginsenosidimutans]MDA0164030.1 hypothetical protein [Solirubrobacter ginsenosidimutans]